AHACPLAEPCEARRLGLQEALPQRARAPAPTPLRMAAAVVWRGSEVLLVKRHSAPKEKRDTGQNWWAGMWQFPSGPVAPDESTPAAAVRLARETTGLEVTPCDVAGMVRHGGPRWKITVEARHCVLVAAEAPPR